MAEEEIVYEFGLSGLNQIADQALDIVSAAFAKLASEFRSVKRFTNTDWIELVIHAYTQLGYDKDSFERGLVAGLFIGAATVGRGYLVPERKEQCIKIAEHIFMHFFESIAFQEAYNDFIEKFDREPNEQELLELARKLELDEDFIGDLQRRWLDAENKR